MAEKSKRELSNQLRKLDKKFRAKQLSDKPLKGDALKAALDTRQKAVDAIRKAPERDKTIIKDVTKRFDDKPQVVKGTRGGELNKPLKTKKGTEWLSKISKLRKGLRAVPVIGSVLGAASALRSGDIMAATPLGASGEIGTHKAVEDPSSPEFKARRQKLNQIMKERAKRKMGKK